MEDVRLIVDIVIALGAATIGGLIAQRLGLPALIGYILAGLVIGPNTPGLVADVDRVQLLANLGVALLMFGLGVEFSLSEVIRVRRAALLGGAIQIPLTVLLGTAAGLAGGWTLGAALLLGGAFAISSSIVALKALHGPGRDGEPACPGGARSRHRPGLQPGADAGARPRHRRPARWRIRHRGIAADLGGGPDRGVSPRHPVSCRHCCASSRGLARASSSCSPSWPSPSGSRWPRTRPGCRWVSGRSWPGSSSPRSDFEEQVLADIIPIRDIFATLFFVAVGMLIDPFALIAQWQLVLGFALVLVVGKLLIIGGALLAAGVDHRTSTLAAVFMAQMGEFSFVLASSGLEHGLIDIGEYGTILSVALCSILAMPILVAISPRLVRIAEHLPGVKRQERLAVGPPPPVAPAGDHVVICGFGRVGAEIGAALDRWDQPYSVIELNPAIVRDLRDAGHRRACTAMPPRAPSWRARGCRPRAPSR